MRALIGLLAVGGGLGIIEKDRNNYKPKMKKLKEVFQRKKNKANTLTYARCFRGKLILLQFLPTWVFLRVKVTGSSKLLIFIGCSETDVMSDSILPKSVPSSVGVGDLNNEKDN